MSQLGESYMQGHFSPQKGSQQKHLINLALEEWCMCMCVHARVCVSSKSLKKDFTHIPTSEGLSTIFESRKQMVSSFIQKMGSEAEQKVFLVVSLEGQGRY